MFETDDSVGMVAQICKFFKYNGSGGSRLELSGNDISCNVCRSWDGRKCRRNSFDSLMKKEY